MEVFVFILGLLGFLIFALQRKTRRRKRPFFRSRQKKDLRRPPVFDAQNVQAPPQNMVLNGPAYVIDGDSLVIAKTQIRLFGVDAPELNHPYGKNAKGALVSLCKGQTIRAEVTAQDIHGRAVAKCYLSDGRDLSAEMVKQGFAIDWAKFSGGKYRALEVADARRRMWLADARQKGRMHVWEQYDAQQAAKGVKL